MPLNPPVEPIEFKSEHEALTVAIEMLNRIASGKSYDSTTFYDALTAMQRVNREA